LSRSVLHGPHGTTFRRRRAIHPSIHHGGCRWGGRCGRRGPEAPPPGCASGPGGWPAAGRRRRLLFVDAAPVRALGFGELLALLLALAAGVGERKGLQPRFGNL